MTYFDSSNADSFTSTGSYSRAYGLLGMTKSVLSGFSSCQVATTSPPFQASSDAIQAMSGDIIASDTKHETGRTRSSLSKCLVASALWVGGWRLGGWRMEVCFLVCGVVFSVNDADVPSTPGSFDLPVVSRGYFSTVAS